MGLFDGFRRKRTAAWALAPLPEPVDPWGKKGEPGQIVHQEPSVRAYPTWTPITLKSAELAADGGNLRLAGDLCEWLFKDERVAADLRTRVGSVLGADLVFEGSGDRRRRQRAVKALEADDDWFTMCPEDEFGLILSWGLMLGISHGQKIWTKSEDTSRLLPCVKFWFGRHLSYNWGERQWYTRVDTANSPMSQSSGSSGYQNVPIGAKDRYWLLNTPYGVNRPWVHGLWRVLSRWCLLKDFAVRDLGLMGEVHGLPTKVIKQLPGAQSYGVDPNLRKQLAADMSMLARNGYMSLPVGFDLELVEATARTYDIYKLQTDLANSAIAVAILGHEMVSDAKDNTNGVTGALTVKQDTLESDEKITTTFAREQVLVDWAEVNYGDPKLAPFPHWGVEAEEDKSKTATTWFTLAQTKEKLRANGADLDNKELEERFDMPLVAFDTPPPVAPPVPGAVPPKPGEPKPKGGEEPPPPAKKPAKKDEKALLDERGVGPLPWVHELYPDHPCACDECFASGRYEQTLAKYNERLSALSAQAKPKPDNGQEYADRVCDSVTAHAAKELAPTLAAMMTAIQKAKTYEEALDIVKAKYERLRTPAELAELTEAAYVMAHLGGELSAVEHAEGDKRT